MVVLAASICTRGGKAVLSRQFREMQRSRVEALLASFPKLADAGTQHTTVEQDNVRYVYQPLDELYMVLITNRQSNILQDIDSLHLFAQVVTSICRSLDEREILKNAFELLSAFDEVVSMGYRENLTLSQIKTFLEMESHEERVALIIESNKQMEASEQRKMKAKQMKEQREQQARAGRNAIPHRPAYPTYTSPMQTTNVDPMDSYAAEKNRSYKSAAPTGKGMQLGKKTRNTNIFEQVKSDAGIDEAEVAAPLVSSTAPLPSAPKHSARPSVSGDRESIHVSIVESISAKLSRDGNMESFDVKGDLQLSISDPSLTQVKLKLFTDDSQGAQFSTHPRVDKAAFSSNKTIQLRDQTKGFPGDNRPLGVMRWRFTAKSGDAEAPLTLNAWVNPGSSEGSYSITLEYQLGDGLDHDDALRDVSVSIPFTSEPEISSMDEKYEISGDNLDWSIGTVDKENPSGAFEFEAHADSDSAFFPMTVQFSKTKPFVDVNVSSVTLINMNEDVQFSRDVRSTAESYVVV